MTNRKSTKRALLGSAMAMVLCLAMLIGATFAWFTDTASTGVNKIQAGNLDITVEYAKEKMNDDGTLAGELTDWTLRPMCLIPTHCGSRAERNM